MDGRRARTASCDLGNNHPDGGGTPYPAGADGGLMFNLRNRGFRGAHITCLDPSGSQPGHGPDIVVGKEIKALLVATLGH